MRIESKHIMYTISSIMNEVEKLVIKFQETIETRVMYHKDCL